MFFNKKFITSFSTINIRKKVKYMDKINSTISFLDKNNNFVDEESATHAIIRETDENGNLIKETYMHMSNKNKENIDVEENTIELSQADIEFIKSFGLNADIDDIKVKKI